MGRRPCWSSVLWWWCLAFPLAAVVWYGGGCGGRLVQQQCLDKGMHYCVVVDVCCPTWATCGTGPQDGGGNGCPLGECCKGSGPPEGGATAPDPWPTDEPVPQDTATGWPPPAHTGGKVPPSRPQ